MQGEQPVAIAARDVGGDLLVQVRGRAQALGEGGAEQDYRAAGSGRAQCRAGAAVLAEQRVQLGPAGLGHGEMAFARGQRAERFGGGRALGAVKIEQAAHPEVAAGAITLLYVEPMEHLHLGPGDERRHPVGRAEHCARAQGQRLAQVHVGHARQLRPGRAIGEPGRHRLTGRVQRLGQWGENGQRITLRRKQQVLGHHVLHDRSH
ncbi:hypothetical protein D3C71_1290990 [compost metagenome]